MTAAAFVRAARSMLGLPWRHRGRNRLGVDCVGLVVLAAAKAGCRIPDHTHYGREPWDDRLRKELKALCGAPVNDWCVGDIALISWGKGEPSHLAILGDYLYGGLSLIHAHNLHGVVEHRLDEIHSQYIQEVYRLWPVKSFQS